MFATALHSSGWDRPKRGRSDQFRPTARFGISFARHTLNYDSLEDHRCSHREIGSLAMPQLTCCLTSDEPPIYRVSVDGVEIGSISHRTKNCIVARG